LKAILASIAGYTPRYWKEGVCWMKKQLFDYINGDVNVVRDEFVLSREANGNGGEFIFVNALGSEKPIYALWNNKKVAKARRIKINVKTEESARETPLKGTGGEFAYVMVMLAAIQNMGQLSMEASWLFLKLFSCIEWNTLRLIDQRTKRTVTRKMLSKMFKAGETKINKAISELKKAGAIEYKNKAYYMNGAVVRKGRSL